MKDIKLCPFRKETVYMSGRNSGAGYPNEWSAHEDFGECLGEQCAAYSEFELTDNRKSWYCKMMR